MAEIPAQKLAAMEAELEALRSLAVTLPGRLALAEEEGQDFFSVMVYGYEVCYTRIGLLRWQAYFADTAD